MPAPAIASRSSAISPGVSPPMARRPPPPRAPRRRRLNNTRQAHTCARRARPQTMPTRDSARTAERSWHVRAGGADKAGGAGRAGGAGKAGGGRTGQVMRARLAGTGTAWILYVVCTVCVLRTITPVYAQFQMPDPKQMSGIPRPVDDLPDGSISVRLIRGSLSNNIANHPVQLLVDGKTSTVQTDEAGRAQFDKIKAGAAVKASADVDGER